MFETGFLGTRAPLFMDIVTVIVALLPFLILGAISLASRKFYNMHATVQKTLFVVSVIVVAYFEYGVRNVGGFDAFMEGSSTPKGYAFWVLIFHISIAVITLVLWIITLLRAKRYRRVNALPGMYSFSHKKAGIRTFIGILMTSVTGIWVYYILFVN
jgi:putative membrane protein